MGLRLDFELFDDHLLPEEPSDELQFSANSDESDSDGETIPLDDEKSI